MRRAGALLGVVVMVVAAFAIRDRVTGDDADAASGDGGGGGGTGIVCPDELAEDCRQAVGDVVRVEPAGATADRLIEATEPAALGAEAWVVPSAWAEVVVAERERLGREPIFAVEPEPIASSPVLLVAWAGPAEELAAACGRPLDFSCVADNAGATIGTNPVRPGGPDVDSATGLTVAAAQAAQLLGRNDFAANDFDTGEFRAQAASLAAGQVQDPVGTMRLQGPGRFTAVGAVAADARNLTSTFGTLQPFTDDALGVRADLVALVPAEAGIDGRRLDALTESFTVGGWDPPADGPDGLPDGGVLAAVRTLWNDAR